MIGTTLSTSGIQFAEYWKQLPDFEIPETVFVPESKSAVENMVGRIIKPAGARFALVYSSPIATEILL